MADGKVRGSPPQREERVRVERKIFRLTRPDGSKYFQVEFRDQKFRRVREPRGGVETLTEARNLRTKLDHELQSGTYVHRDDRKRREEEERRRAEEAIGPTFDEFADRFVRDYVRGRCRSDFYDVALRPIRHYFTGRRLRTITAADLDNYRAHCLDRTRPIDKRDRPVGRSTTRKRLIVLGTLFRYAARWGVIDRSPAADLEKPGEPEHKTRYLSREEFDRLKAHAEPWLQPILTAAILTGARLKEVVGLRWENVDREAGVLFLSEDNKSGKPRGIPIAATLRKTLDELPGGRFKRDGLVFLAPDDEPLTSQRQRNRVSQRTKAAAKAAGLAAVTFHTMRHSAASWLAQAGHSQVKIAKLLGHATVQTTNRYMHLSPAHLRDAADGLDAALRGSIGEILETSPSDTTPAPDAVSDKLTLPNTLGR